MKIKQIILQNFRGYKDKTIIPFTDFTAFIGKNDAGKSTILEALDIFFEEAKPEPNDASVHADAKEVLIGIVFESLPPEITLDRGARSTFSAEYLLNTDGNLEIHKIYDLNLQRPGAPKIFAMAHHPTADDVAELLQKTNTQLKALIKQHNLEANCSLNENPSMRQALYNKCSDLELDSVEVPLNEDNGKAIWAAIQKRLPLFALFRSDRASSDQDAEVQNPMKAAVQKALSELQDELQSVTSEVRKRAEETANRTLLQLQSTYPDIANSLTPHFKSPSWNNLFKVDLESDDGVPLNKRGSGVRRLVLMSFFQAEAEKRRSDLSDGELDGNIPVIYAIEEPETSQHPENQEKIINALRELSDAGDQIIITTHVPALASLIPVESLRYIDRDPVNSNPRIRSGNADVYQEIATALGVLPDPIKTDGVRVAVLVEGKTDVDALLSFSQVLASAGEIESLDEERIFWTLGGGETLKDWVERNYLGSLNLPQVVIFDSDRTSENLPAHEDKQRRLRDINSWNNRTAFMTRKGEIENYIDPEELNTLTDGKLVFPAGFDPDFSDMPRLFAEALRDAIDNRNLNFRAIDHEGNQIRATKRNSKKILTSYVMRMMTANGIKRRCAYEEDGVTKYEIIEWLEAINEYCMDAQT